MSYRAFPFGARIAGGNLCAKHKIADRRESGESRQAARLSDEIVKLKGFVFTLIKRAEALFSLAF